MKELCELTDEATGADIVNAELRLQLLPKIKMNPKKIESLQKKYDSIQSPENASIFLGSRFGLFCKLPTLCVDFLLCKAIYNITTFPSLEIKNAIYEV